MVVSYNPEPAANWRVFYAEHHGLAADLAVETLDIFSEQPQFGFQFGQLDVDLPCLFAREWHLGNEVQQGVVGFSRIDAVAVHPALITTAQSDPGKRQSGTDFGAEKFYFRGNGIRCF